MCRTMTSGYATAVDGSVALGRMISVYNQRSQQEVSEASAVNANLWVSLASTMTTVIPF